MNLYTNISNLQKSLTDRADQSKRSQPSTQIGAKINASISQDLGGGRYLLNLGGSETLYVESETGFTENERVELQVRSNSDGKVELKLLSRNNTQSQNVSQIATSDTAVVTRELQLVIKTKDLPAIYKNESIDTTNSQSTQTNNTQTTKQNTTSHSSEADNKAGTNIAQKTNSTTEIKPAIEIDARADNRSQSTQSEQQVSTQPSTQELRHTQNGQITQDTTANKTQEIQIIISHPDNSSEPSSVKIVLPDGKVISAEILKDGSELPQIIDGDKTKSLKDILINDISSAANTDPKEAGEESTKSQASSIKNLLTAVASKLFSSSSVENLDAADKASVAKMLIERLTLPIMFPNSIAAQSSLLEKTNIENSSPQLSVNLSYQDVVKMLPDLLNTPFPISLAPTPEGGYQLEFQSPELLPKTLPIPQESNDTISNILNTLGQQNGESTPIKIGIKSLLQGIIKESIHNIPTNTPATSTEELSSKPQLDAQKLDALIKRSGMTPSTATREAATALLGNSLPVTRENIQSLLALSAGKSGTERTEFLQAGAKLLSLDAPLSPALASGMSKLHTDEGFISSSIQKISASLEEATNSTSTTQTSQKEGELSQLDQKSAQTLIQNFSRASETLRGIPVLIEALSSTAEEALKNTEMPPQAKTPSEQSTLADELKDFVSTSSRERLSAVETILQNSATTILESDPILSKLSSSLDTVLTKLGNLPEETEQVITKVTEEKPENSDLARLKDVIKQELSINKESDKEFNFKDLLNDLSSLKSRASHPGISKVPEFWQKVELEPTTLQNADMTKVKTAVEQIMNAPTPERAQELTKELLRSVDRDTLRTLASTLQEVEREEIQKHPTLQHIREASNELRELGRALVAQKAENIATSRNDPGSFNTSIPFNFNGGDNGEEDGQLSMFYNKRKSKKGNWQQRVILDLNMSALGNIIGDIQFHEGMINVNFVSSNKETVSILESEQESLLTGLEDIGFKASIGVRLLIPETEANKTEHTASKKTTRLLDVKA